MSKIATVFLFTTIAMIALSVLFEVPFLKGGSGLIFVVALVYCYTLSKRDAELLSYAMTSSDTDQD